MVSPDVQLDKKQIVVVDDNQSLLMLVANILSDEGYLVAAYNNPPDALEDVRRKRPDFLVLDIKMPIMDGPELLNVLDQDPVTANIPAMFISATNYPKGLIRGSARFLGKPFDLDDLIRVVAEGLNGYGLAGLPRI